MTDWLPWGFVVMAGTFSTIALTLSALQRTPAGHTPNLRAAWWALAITVILSLAVYSMYLATGERWIWYQ